MKKQNLILIMTCIAFMTMGIVLLFFSLFAVYKVYELPMKLEISEQSSFNTDTDALNFGKAQIGNSNSRMIMISHDYSRPLLITFKKEGDISPFIVIPEQFYLEPGLSKEVTLTAKIPPGAVLGGYSGRLTVYFRRI
ncbi:MAG: hypothetical protein V1729_04745 [Candidatus Woesearchaeota archaeon]